jgi:hypothetical protein
MPHSCLSPSPGSRAEPIEKSPLSDRRRQRHPGRGWRYTRSARSLAVAVRARRLASNVAETDGVENHGGQASRPCRTQRGREDRQVEEWVEMSCPPVTLQARAVTTGSAIAVPSAVAWSRGRSGFRHACHPRRAPPAVDASIKDGATGSRGHAPIAASAAARLGVPPAQLGEIGLRRPGRMDGLLCESHHGNRITMRTFLRPHAAPAEHPRSSSRPRTTIRTGLPVASPDALGGLRAVRTTPATAARRHAIGYGSNPPCIYPVCDPA